VREALRPDVVNLTKDLNGNHVIQKCLGQLDSEEKQVFCLS
jgi:Pumilio-family RNA binding repeat